MNENFTQSEGLVEAIPGGGWFAGPEGQQGFEVVVFKKTKTGEKGRHIRTLKPGEKLDFSERFFTEHIALAVDLRFGRFFTIQRDFDAYERGRSVTVEAKVRYSVTDVNNVATNHIDPLGALRDKVISILNRELKTFREADITPTLVEDLILGVGYPADLGLKIEGAEVINFKGDDGVTKAIVSHDNLDYEISIAQKKQEAERRAKSRDAEVDRGMRDEDDKLKLRQTQRWLETIDLTNPNHLMQLHSDLIPQILATFAERENKLLTAKIGLVNQAVDAYVRDQNSIKGEVDPKRIIEIVKGFLPIQSQVGSHLITSDILYENEQQIRSGMDDDIIYHD